MRQYEGAVEVRPGRRSTTRRCSSPTAASPRRSRGRLGLRLVDAGQHGARRPTPAGLVVITQIAADRASCSRFPRTTCRRCWRDCAAAREPPVEAFDRAETRHARDRHAADRRQRDRSRRPARCGSRRSSRTTTTRSSRISSSTRASSSTSRAASPWCPRPPCSAARRARSSTSCRPDQTVEVRAGARVGVMRGRRRRDRRRASRPASWWSSTAPRRCARAARSTSRSRRRRRPAQSPAVNPLAPFIAAAGRRPRC